MNKFTRALRHLTTTRIAGKRAFPTTTLNAIQSAIAEGEAVHRAEMRLIVEPSLDICEILTGMTSRQRASELFTLYRIWDTEENCGVLIYINLADHQVEIIADRGLTRLIPAEDWQRACKKMTDGFAQGNYHDSVIDGITHLNTLMQRHFPEGDSQPDQLSNQPIML